jgi:hypothetical protein
MASFEDLFDQATRCPTENSIEVLAGIMSNEDAHGAPQSG